MTILTSSSKIDDSTLHALNRRENARKAYKKARSRYMGFVVSHNDWSDDPRMAEAREAARAAWEEYESADVYVSLVTGLGEGDWTHKP